MKPVAAMPSIKSILRCDRPLDGLIRVDQGHFSDKESPSPPRSNSGKLA